MIIKQKLNKRKTFFILVIFFSLAPVWCLRGENEENRVQSQNMTTKKCWEHNAQVWDELSGDGRAFQVQVVDPVIDALLPKIGPKTKVLEIACGNGFLARRLAKMGSSVVAIDGSANLIELAKQRTKGDLADKIRYQVADATDPKTYDKMNDAFDFVVCNMSRGFPVVLF